jgi:hypothetical protein
VLVLLFAKSLDPDPHSLKSLRIQIRLNECSSGNILPVFYGFPNEIYFFGWFIIYFDEYTVCIRIA